MLLFGEIPKYISDRQLAGYINRKLQLQLCEPPRLEYWQPPPEMKPKPVYRDARGRKVSEYIWELQPRKFPKGWYSMALKDPNWRWKYQHRWMRKRKAAGLPFVVHNPAVRRKAA